MEVFGDGAEDLRAGRRGDVDCLRLFRKRYFELVRTFGVGVNAAPELAEPGN